MGIVERKQRQKEALRREMLDASLRIARKDGWDAVSTRRVAEEVDYSTTAIYHYFGNKDSIMAELQSEGFHRMAGRIKCVLDALEGNPKGQLFALSMEHWNFAMENMELYQLMFGTGGIPCPAKPSVEMMRLGSAIQHVIEELTSVPIEEVMMNWWAYTSGFINIVLTHRDECHPLDPKEVYIKGIKRFIDSL